ncbi:hypothetical protein [Vibrio furnissii]|uniref:hypothetical protein n=1 Tax=Vibrio furnissii TaxID=29494 RepID=UPI00130285B4|nr:hypothetical protein [Vibrio furnissii]
MRKVAYYLPNLHLESNISLGAFRLIKASNFEDKDTLIDPNVFGDINGTLIEVGDFSTGDNFSSDVDESIYRELELIKFSYFFASVSNYFDFVSNDTFEVLRVIEKNKNPSFEHKVRFSNGVDSYLMPLDKYFNAKVLSGSFGHVSVSDFDLKCYQILKQLPISDDDLMIITIFNKTRNLYTSFDFIDRVLFARIAVEKLAKKLDWKLPTVTQSFIEVAMDFVQKNKGNNQDISVFYSDHVLEKKEQIRVNIEQYLKDLKDARHALAHAGEQDNSYDNISFFMAWFPVAFLLSFEHEDSNEELAFRTIFLLAASSVNLKKWQERDFTSLRAKRTILESYEHHSRVIPVFVSRGEKEIIKNHLIGLANAVNNVS